jgi:hypothetical protein
MTTSLMTRSIGPGALPRSSPPPARRPEHDCPLEPENLGGKARTSGSSSTTRMVGGRTPASNRHAQPRPVGLLLHLAHSISPMSLDPPRSVPPSELPGLIRPPRSNQRAGALGPRLGPPKLCRKQAPVDSSAGQPVASAKSRRSLCPVAVASRTTAWRFRALVPAPPGGAGAGPAPRTRLPVNGAPIPTMARRLPSPGRCDEGPAARRTPRNRGGRTSNAQKQKRKAPITSRKVRCPSAGPTSTEPGMDQSRTSG